MERAKSDARVEKTAALEALRGRVQQQHAANEDRLKTELGERTEQLAKAKQDRATTVEQAIVDHKRDKVGGASPSSPSPSAVCGSKSKRGTLWKLFSSF